MRHLPGSGHHHGSERAGGRRYRAVFGIAAVKLAVVALFVALPSGLAIGLGAAHGVALAVAGVAALSLFLFRRNRKPRSLVSHPQHGEEAGR